MAVEAADYSQFLRRVRNRTWNGQHKSMTIWLTPAEHDALVSLSAQTNEKVGVLAKRLIRDGLISEALKRVA